MNFSKNANRTGLAVSSSTIHTYLHKNHLPCTQLRAILRLKKNMGRHTLILSAAVFPSHSQITYAFIHKNIGNNKENTTEV